MWMAVDLAVSERGPSLWQPRRPEGTPLYRLLESRYEPVKQTWEDRFEDRYGFWRGMVDGAVARYLERWDLRERLRAAPLRRLSA
jgi:hypothetical protein